jgi:prevent-host-death family protein
MKTITVTEAARNFSDFINRVHYQGESALLVRGGRPMAKVTPAHRANTGAELAELWPSLAHLSVAEAVVLGDELDAARSRLPAPASQWD